MTQKIRADGDRWRVRMGTEPPGPDLQAVLFFCETSGQRPYRVVEVSRERVPDAGALEALPAGELRKLFEASRSLDFPRSYA